MVGGSPGGPELGHLKAGRWLLHRQRHALNLVFIAIHSIYVGIRQLAERI